MSVVKISIKNFLSVKEVEIEAGKINQVYGKNNQGKTTVLKALDFAFKGSSDPNLVKIGEDSAEVIVELRDSLVVSRKLNASGKQSLSVTKAGMKAQAPQSYLSHLFDGISFNPLEILEPKNRNQFILRALDLKIDKEELSELSGMPLDELPDLDFSGDALQVIEQAHSYHYLRRSDANKKAKASKARLDTYAEDIAKMNLMSEPTKPKSVLEQEMLSITQEIITERARVSSIKRQKEDKEKKAGSVSFYKTQVDTEQKKLAELEAEYQKNKAVIEERISNNQNSQKKAELELNSVVIESEDKSLERLQELQKSLQLRELAMKDIETYEAQEAQRRVLKDLEKIHSEDLEEAKKADNNVKALGPELRAKVIEKAELPVQGLSFDGKEFHIGASSIDHLSSSASLKLALALVKRLAQKTKLICIDGAELLDEETFKVLKQEMESDDFTYFFTKVGEPFDGADLNLEAKQGTYEVTDGHRS